MFQTPSKRSIRTLAALGILALGGVACGGDDVGSDAAGAGAMAESRPEVELEPAPELEVETMELGGTAVPSVGASVVKTADVRLEIARGGFSAAVQEVESIAATYGGFVLSTSLDDAASKRGRIVLRVPSGDFEQALSNVKDSGELLGQNISGQDVSQEFIDLEARINNMQAQEAVFLDLMDRATTISQTVRMQNHLSNLQLDIEKLQGRLNYLEDRTALGTISVSLVEEGAPAPESDGAFQSAWGKAVDVLEGIGAAALFLVVVLLPFALIGLIALVVFRQVRPRPTT